MIDIKKNFENIIQVLEGNAAFTIYFYVIYGNIILIYINIGTDR